MTPVILFGGKSPEHAVSVASAAHVANALLQRGQPPLLVGIGKTGRLFYYPHFPASLTADGWEASATPLTVTLDEGGALFSAKGLPPFRPEKVFSLLHGGQGEDGHWQGFLSLLSLPFVGSGLLSSALCMNKAKAKALASYYGVPTAPFLVAENASTETLAEVLRTLSYPLFVKPLSGGRSLGVSRVESAVTLRSALKTALSYDGRAILEEEIAGSELSVGVLEKKGRLLLSPVGELRSDSGFFDYDKKYKTHTAHFAIPALLSEKEEKQVKDTAAFLFRLFECRGFARIDFLRNKKGAVFFNEVNTIPGFTADSLFPRLFAAIGIDPLSFLLEDEE
ncbi:MAG: D-alanine--D-alanine ligase [Clostridia bacterium]|nr:D-alanine--D-alanine ligase [Clostridia bacterium]